MIPVNPHGKFPHIQDGESNLVLVLVLALALAPDLALALDVVVSQQGRSVPNASGDQLFGGGSEVVPYTVKRGPSCRCLAADRLIRRLNNGGMTAGQYGDMRGC